MAVFSGETGLKASVGVFLLSCTFLTSSYHITFVFDRPIVSAIVSCLVTATFLLLLSKFIYRLPKPTISSSHKYSIIPLAEQGEDQPGEILSPKNGFGVPSIKSRDLSWWIRIALATGLGCIRLELYRQNTLYVECAPAGFSYAIPFLVSLYDYWRNQRCRPIERWTPEDNESNSKLRMLATICQRIYFYICQSRSRFIISALFLMSGGLVASSFNDGRQSTYICPSTSGLATHLQFFSFLGLFLDSLILIVGAELCREGSQPREVREKQTLVSWGYSLLGVSIVWTVVQTIVDKDSFLLDSHHFQTALGHAFLIAFLVSSTSQLIPHYGIMGIATLAGFIFSYYSWVTTLFNGQEPFPLIITSHALVGLTAIFIGVMIFLLGRTASEEEPKFLYRFNILMRYSFSLVFGIGLILAFTQPRLANFHPIDLLIYDGRNHHKGWLSQAKGSSSLYEAVIEYQRRYNQHPPPGFDKWYKYATNRSSVVIDEFDQINHDLLPFRALSPAELRSLTFGLATNPFNDLGGIIIRNGTAKVQDGIKPTHAWMVQSAAQMINKFSEHLPDMDLVFNLNDEPRIAVPWERIDKMRDQATRQPKTSDEDLVNRWSTNRNSTWAPIEPADQTTETLFTDFSWQNIFDRYVSLLCPPSSKARSQRIWDRHNLCLSCVRPHSMGQFSLSWDAASDICHQPDLANLHGFFISPASFKVSQELAPVFSQSKVSGFGDILFPSPWNYADKVKYEPSDEFPDPEYSEKANTLLWIGSTSEGVSHDGFWKGIPRQRFSHLINNNTLNKVSVLLPTNQPSSELAYEYQIMDGTAPSKQLGLNTSVCISDVVRCGDCDEQVQELGTGSWMDFQNHWSHRYLFDLDGAGFSGRFLPFLQSHSLPFKTGLFRQWFDSRVTSWMHYVPVDLRLHGVWSTLAYFAGVNVTVGTTEKGEQIPLMEPHDLQGKWIAEEGRKWADLALRKEDMEIYFFRLLLEWGRLTDDRRDVLGYRHDELI